jgi:hypothetical protein
LTIAHLISRTNYSIFIKPHIIARQSKININDGAIRALREEFAAISRVQWLPGDVTVSDLAQSLVSDSWFGISGHGTVAEDLTYLGVPAVVSVLGPWGNHAKFAWHHRSWDEYLNLLVAGPSLGLNLDTDANLVDYLQIRYWRTKSWNADGIERFFNFVCRQSHLDPPSTHSSAWDCAQEALASLEVVARRDSILIRFYASEVLLPVLQN